MERNQTLQSTTTAHQMAYTERPVFYSGDNDLRNDALCVLSKVLPIYLLFFCPFLKSFIVLTINQNLKGVVISFTVI
jgi:hypothetical protein